jgi:hypothetical protein
MRRAWLAVALAAICFTALPAFAQTPDLLRSDLPMWSEAHPDVWPRPIDEGDGVVGYGSIFWLGYWRRVDRNCSDPSDCTSWWRLDLASVIHGAFTLETGRETSKLDWALGGSAVIAELHGRNAKERLYALQVGFLGGSQYVLLSAPTAAPVKRMTILDGRCEDAGRHAIKRKAGFYTRYITAYCAVRDVEGLRMMARAAGNRPPLATLEWVESSER